MGIIAVSIFVAFLEMAGVASIFPLIAIVIDPDGLAKSPIANAILKEVGLTTMPPLHVIGFATIVLIVVSNLASLLLSWWSAKFSGRLSVALSKAFASSHLGSIPSFLSANSPTESAHQMCTEVAKFTTGAVLQLCLLIVKIAQLVVIAAFLMVVAPLYSLTFIAVAGVLYAISYRYSSRRLQILGGESFLFAAKSVQRATEMFSVARESFLFGNAPFLVRRVSESLQRFHRADAISRVLPTLPKYALEVLGVCAIFSVPIYRSLMEQDFRAELPILATFAYAGFRLLPALQQAYSSASILRFHLPMATEISRALGAPASRSPDVQGAHDMPETLEFRGVTFTHIGRDKEALVDVSFQIRKGERVAIVGDSGAGKSTLIDIILGFLQPQGGHILLDGIPCSGGRLLWAEGSVGFVSQVTMLLEGSVAENIAFGREDGGRARVMAAAEKAGVANLIDIRIGGDDQSAASAKISGGEAQRISIARSLHSSPGLLVLDEPVSSLDPPNTRRIFELLCSPELGATVITVTHDVGYLEKFDRVIFIRRGRVIAAGPHESLMRDCAEFRQFVGHVGDRRMPQA